jgi:predicted nucleotide-binding protein (sugar kinase/HSP70/actin superfamily)
MRIGIPRALMSYRYYPFLKTFLEGCGHEVLSSPPTDLGILQEGVEGCVDDVCVAVKVFIGHVRFLEGKAEALLVPRPVSVEKRGYDTFTCPKLIAAPDMARFFPRRPPLLLEWVLDVRRAPWWWGCLRLAARLRVSPVRAWRAYLAARREHSAFGSLLLQGLLPDEALSVWENMVINRLPMGIEGIGSESSGGGQERHGRSGGAGATERLPAFAAEADWKGLWVASLEGTEKYSEEEPRIPSPWGKRFRVEGLCGQAGTWSPGRGEAGRGKVRRERVTVGVVGHPYLLADRLANKNLIRWLEEAGALVVPCTALSPRELEEEVAHLPLMSWSYERELLAATSCFARRKEVDGVAYITSFGCGPDSMAMEVARREVVAPSGKPFLEVVLDEHSADSGVRTRAEAFVDMLNRRKGAGAGGTTPRRGPSEGRGSLRRGVSRACTDTERSGCARR